MADFSSHYLLEVDQPVYFTHPYVECTGAKLLRHTENVDSRPTQVAERHEGNFSDGKIL